MVSEWTKQGLNLIFSHQKCSMWNISLLLDGNWVFSWGQIALSTGYGVAHDTVANHNCSTWNIAFTHYFPPRLASRLLRAKPDCA